MEVFVQYQWRAEAVAATTAGSSSNGGTSDGSNSMKSSNGSSTCMDGNEGFLW